MSSLDIILPRFCSLFAAYRKKATPQLQYFDKYNYIRNLWIVNVFLNFFLSPALYIIIMYLILFCRAGVMTPPIRFQCLAGLFLYGYSFSDFYMHPAYRKVVGGVMTPPYE